MNRETEKQGEYDSHTRSTEAAEACRLVIDGQIPMKFTMMKIGSLDQPVPFYCSARRILPLTQVLEDVKDHFDALVVSLDSEQPIWFSYGASVLTFEWTVGALYDMYAIDSPPPIPWSVEVHFGEYPTHSIGKPPTKIETMDMLSSQAIDSLSLTPSPPESSSVRSLLALALRGEFWRFAEEYDRLLPTEGKAVFRVVSTSESRRPIDPFPVARRRVVPLDDTSIGAALELPHGARVVCQGVRLEHYMTVVDVFKAFSAPTFTVTILVR
ncbi:autophagy 5-like [Carpediemonas membranifera]|uniref:Autophagy 5-like n=1 Tax=Carpediemonas membranifera TaxID=201153 RepID=A0A8J6B5P2_9EUKA|nr:autophagy 5-like [Carpediemonas membranifera]|eukprot:KAG9393392.1 autophagy 5-like [Carpediemonas membranifera]